MNPWDKQSGHYGGKPFTIHWNDGTKTILPEMDLISSPKCGACGEETGHVEFVQYCGLCRGCFATNTFGMPKKMKVGKSDFHWRRPVEVTRDLPESRYSQSFLCSPRGADREGYNFGIGDTVKHNPGGEKKAETGREGKILALHEYVAEYDTFSGKPDFRYMTRVFFGPERNLLLPAHELEALTCNAVAFNIKRWEGKLEEVTFDKEPPVAMKKAFENPVARAIWLSYRMNHLCDSQHLNKLTNESVEMAYELEQARLPRDRINLWLTKRCRKSGLQIQQDQVEALLPYLTGEREAKYSIKAVA